MPTKERKLFSCFHFRRNDAFSDAQWKAPMDSPYRMNYLRVNFNQIAQSVQSAQTSRHQFYCGFRGKNARAGARIRE